VDSITSVFEEQWVMTSEFLAGVHVAESVWSAHPDYVTLVMTVHGLQSGESDAQSDAMLVRAQAQAAEWLSVQPIEEMPEVLKWREKFLSFGVKHKTAKSSVEALLKRSSKGLPRVDRLTDLYNAISVLHQVPIGGEDLDAYQGSARLMVATGSEEFATRENGELVSLAPAQGEIIWCDDLGVTCRRWNWRQCVRTQLNKQTRNAVFIFDGIGEDAQLRVTNAARELADTIEKWWPDARIEKRTLSLTSR
jgi:DNA/RNA-binding domain of Phe-tRNA-synthetase-like protein